MADPETVTLPDSPEGVAAAAALLAAGALVAFPTETVYGLGADALDDRGGRRASSPPRAGRPSTR